MRTGSLFSGYEGLTMAVNAFYRSETAWVSDIDKGACTVLAHHWPQVPNLGDITAIDWAEVEPVDILTGGFPCQDLSHAGKRAGMAGARSGLWSHMATAIDTLRPELVVIENVRGILSAKAHSDLEHCQWCVGDRKGKPDLRALGCVLGDLAQIGYDAQWTGLRASDIGAPHQRLRIFITAHPHGQRLEGSQPAWGRHLSAGSCGPSIGALLPTPNGRVSQDGEGFATWNVRRAQFQETHDYRAGMPLTIAVQPEAGTWGSYLAAIQRWESLTRPAPDPTDDKRLNPAFVEWMMGLPLGHVTDVGLTRAQQLKTLGNGVIPQQAYEALRRLDHLTRQESAA